MMVVAVQVMRAEAESETAEEAEEDSAFGSNRSGSPSDAPAKPHKGGVEEEHEEEEEEGEAEGVASWASVRMLGDRQRQRAVKEEAEVFSLLLKGSVCELHFPRCLWRVQSCRSNSLNDG